MKVDEGNEMSLEILLLGAILALQVVLVMWGRKGGGSGFYVVSDQLKKIEAMLGGVDEMASAVKDARGVVTKINEEVLQLKGRISAFDERQEKGAEALSKIPSELSSRLGEGILQVSKCIQEEFGRNVVPMLDSTRRLLADGNSSAEQRFKGFSDSQVLQFKAAQEATAAAFKEIREDAAVHRKELAIATNEMRKEISVVLTRSAESIEKKMDGLRQSTDARVTDLRNTVDSALKAELGAIRTENSAKLEEMRKTVDEKLHATLEQRLGESFKQVSERLELVHRGLGEMQSLATGVGDLKKVLTNVKTRGTWGEVQLGALLEQILTADQYAKNVATKPRSSARVEFAIRLPGRSDNDEPVWLPIDAKFPMEDYQRLTDAQERADLLAIDEAGRALEVRIRQEAKTIREKYIEPPHTTDFAILYLPTEGLYAEVLRRPGLADSLQRDQKVSIAGPTTIAALLNSLQMGFRSIAIERRSSEVWTVLSAVKTEFGNFGEALAKTKKKLQEAQNSIERAETRSRVLTRKLSGVDSMPAPDAALVLGSPEDEFDGDDDVISKEDESTA